MLGETDDMKELSPFIKDLMEQGNNVYSAVKVIGIIAKADSFLNWLGKEKRDNKKEVFDGFKFFISVAINSLIDSIALDFSLGLTEDEAFERASFIGKSIHDVPASSEKTIIIKRLTLEISHINHSKSWTQLNNACIKLNELVKPISKIFEKHMRVEHQIGREKAIDLALRTYIDRYLGDCSDGCPMGWSIQTTTTIKMNEYYMARCFHGYVLGLQYLWMKVLGKRRYNSTFITEMDKCRSISGDQARRLHDELFKELPILDKDFIIESEDVEDGSDDDETMICWLSLNEFSKRIYEEIIVPDKLKLGLEQFEDVWIKLNPIDKQELGEILNPCFEPPDYFEKRDPKSTMKRIAHLMYDYEIIPIEFPGRETIIGIPTFLTLLKGDIRMGKKESETIPSQVVVFEHESTDGVGSFLSYAILIGRRTGFSDASHWLLFPRIGYCSEWEKDGSTLLIEKLLKEYKKGGMVVVRNTKLPLRDLKEYTETWKRVCVSEKKGLTFRNANEIITADRQIIQVAKSKLFEYAFGRYLSLEPGEEDVKVDVLLHKQQVDVLSRKSGNLEVYECKLDLHSDIDEVIIQLIKKINKIKSKEPTCFVTPHLVVYEEINLKKKEQLELKGILIIDNFRKIIKESGSEKFGHEKERLIEVLDFKETTLRM